VQQEPAEPPAIVDLRELTAYFKDPAKQVLSGALKLRLDAVGEGGLRESEVLDARADAIDQVAKRLFNEAVVRPDLALPDVPPDWLRLTGVLPPGRAGDEAWKDELNKARALVDVVARHELFAGGRPQAHPVQIEQPVATRVAPALLRGELRRVFERAGSRWIAECYPGKDGKNELNFKPRIALFLDWALLRLATPAETPVRACVIVRDGQDDGWGRSFDGWDERLRKARGDEAIALRGELERRVAGLVEFWRRSQLQPQWYFPLTSWTLAKDGPQKARERWLGTRANKAERDYEPGYAGLLGRDNDLFDGTNLAQLHANAIRLRALIDLMHPLMEGA
jgi:exodeoxyribonuclease V gamma subunit